MRLITKILSVFLLFLALSISVNQTFASGDGYLAFAEQMPAPIEGMKEIYKHISYPKLAQQAGIQGKVFLLCFIDESGTVNDVKVVKGIGAGCDEAASEAVKKIKFSPGKNKGKPVKVKLSLSIVFKIK